MEQRMSWIKLGRENKTFSRYCAETLLVFGLVTILIELFLVPRAYWLYALPYLVPGTILAVVFVSFIEYSFFRYIQRRNDRRANEKSPSQ